MPDTQGYIEPKDAPFGVPCRFCDFPADTAGRGKVVADGVAVDKTTPLFSHPKCFLEKGGFQADNYDFSLQSLQPNNKASLGFTSSVEDDIWNFSLKNRFIATSGRPTEEVKDLTRTDAEEEYKGDGTGASIPPSN
jgi:hypothetical protein